MTEPTRDQLVQMARQFLHAAHEQDPRCSQLLRRLSERMDLPPFQCLAGIKGLASSKHPLDATVGAMWAEAFRAA